MQVPKYSAMEIERRFLVVDLPDLSGARMRLIEDNYVSGTRMRLRAITHADGRDPEFKLCKKYPSEAALGGPITNLYLTAQEHAVLAALPGAAVRKRRYSVPWKAWTFSIDVFEGALSGLVLSEVEADLVEDVNAIELPSWIAREVTADPFFRGGALAMASAEDLRRRLAGL